MPDVSDPEATESDVPEPDWLIRRDGSVDEVLTTDGTWGPIQRARWFTTQDEALAALETDCPPGTTGTAVQQHPEGHD
jgi:hypothetical protein